MPSELNNGPNQNLLHHTDTVSRHADPSNPLLGINEIDFSSLRGLNTESPSDVSESSAILTAQNAACAEFCTLFDDEMSEGNVLFSWSSDLLSRILGVLIQAVRAPSQAQLPSPDVPEVPRSASRSQSLELCIDPVPAESLPSLSPSSTVSTSALPTPADIFNNNLTGDDTAVAFTDISTIADLDVTTTASSSTLFDSSAMQTANGHLQESAHSDPLYPSKENWMQYQYADDGKLANTPTPYADMPSRDDDTSFLNSLLTMEPEEKFLENGVSMSSGSHDASRWAVKSEAEPSVNRLPAAWLTQPEMHFPRPTMTALQLNVPFTSTTTTAPSYSSRKRKRQALTVSKLEGALVCNVQSTSLVPEEPERKRHCIKQPSQTSDEWSRMFQPRPSPNPVLSQTTVRKRETKRTGTRYAGAPQVAKRVKGGLVFADGTPARELPTQAPIEASHSDPLYPSNKNWMQYADGRTLASTTPPYADMPSRDGDTSFLNSLLTMESKDKFFENGVSMSSGSHGDASRWAVKSEAESSVNRLPAAWLTQPEMHFPRPTMTALQPNVPFMNTTIAAPSYSSRKRKRQTSTDSKHEGAPVPTTSLIPEEPKRKRRFQKQPSQISEERPRMLRPWPSPNPVAVEPSVRRRGTKRTGARNAGTPHTAKRVKKKLVFADGTPASMEALIEAVDLRRVVPIGDGYECVFPECHVQIADKDLLAHFTGHCLTVDLPKIAGRYQCPMSCSATLHDLAAVARHVRDAHLKAQKMYCSTCGGNFTRGGSRDQIIRHLQAKKHAEAWDRLGLHWVNGSADDEAVAAVGDESDTANADSTFDDQQEGSSTGTNFHPY